MFIVQLSAVTLAPVAPDRTPLTPERLRDMILDIRSESDRVEHVKVIERAGLMWVGAYVSVGDQESAQNILTDLCTRATNALCGWEIIRQHDS